MAGSGRRPFAEGVDYRRRFRRHRARDDGAAGCPVTTVLAPHGGDIEVGTSELCLAVAGYHPETLAPIAEASSRYDYWMFEGLRSTDNRLLHVTSTSCDDPQAEALCGGAVYSLSLHGCKPGQAGLPDTGQAVVVGGLDATLKAHLLQEYAAVGIPALDGAAFAELAGVSPRNIVNRNLSGAGAQLELTTPLRNAMFGTNTRARRKHTTLPLFWTFVAATRAAVARRVAG
ncbi:poly-gamma-glutamate hydrolase family protein [Micromonospora phytophila]|uniref:poly-gamma-glutamate hydrolase family protein n=1 Tax=Micromonospora phytophila TaxID=709888 RepID=UPI00202E3C7E|nr:poly-gamma-glutamate hydrolase family protein [Micromonospora phytophila]MCM0677631.1 poly-gamma-glutamate hydrolase family protein [Micromonospora phytophila]